MFTKLVFHNTRKSAEIEDFFHGLVILICFPFKELDQIDINTKLFVAAEKYEIVDLLNFCAMCMVENLNKENAAQLMISAFLVNHKLLLRHACQFIFENGILDNIVETKDWKDLEEGNPLLALKMIENYRRLEANF